MSSHSYVHVDIDEVVKETEGAFLVLIEGEQYWLPKSQIADAKDYEEGDCGCTMSVTEFIAKQKGLGG